MNAKNAFARGLNFCLPPKHVKLGRLLTKGNQDHLKNQLKNISYSYIYSYDVLKQKNILRKDEWTALMDLHKDDSIIITQTGKGNGAVIINKLAWLSPEKWKHYISDDSKFKELKTTQ